MNSKMGLFVFKPDASGKEINAILSMVDVVVSLIMAEGRILLVFNPKWGSFTVPTTKRRLWEDPNAAKGAIREEPWDLAATRATAEVLGCTLTVAARELGELPEFQQSDRDGVWKRYRLQAFLYTFAKMNEVHPVVIHEWLTPDQILDEARNPISPTARHVISELTSLGLITRPAPK
ncbi:MAG: hypothetical protein O3C57_01855 [Verrucomicrobia bacterium]|nr:hypothetical protein [Verrucomicrobiota bacterium]